MIIWNTDFPSNPDIPKHCLSAGIAKQGGREFAQEWKMLAKSVYDKDKGDKSA